jgi:hypothetical protein
MPSPALWRPVTRRALRVERLAEPDCGRCFCIWTRPATLDFQRLTISQQISDLPTAYEQLQPPVGHLNIEGVQQYCVYRSTQAVSPKGLQILHLQGPAQHFPPWHIGL